MASTNLLFSVLAWSDKSELLFAIAVIFDDIAAAFATVAFVAFISLLVDRAYTATQYALLASIGTAGRTTLASSSGALVDWLNGDWGIFFILTAIMVIPSLIILWIMRNKLKQKKVFVLGEVEGMWVFEVVRKVADVGGVGCWGAGCFWVWGGGGVVFDGGVGWGG